MADLFTHEGDDIFLDDFDLINAAIDKILIKRGVKEKKVIKIPVQFLD